MRDGFYVSKNATRLILTAQNKILQRENTAFVLTDYSETSNLKKICGEYKIPLHSFSHEQHGFTGKERNKYISDVFLSLLNNNKCDYGFIWGGRLLLVGDILAEFKNRLINLHPSLLPAYKGSIRAIDDALRENVILLGNTAHFVNENADDGIMIKSGLFRLNNYEV